MKQNSKTPEKEDHFEKANQESENTIKNSPEKTNQKNKENFRTSQNINEHRQHIFDKTRPSETPSLVDLRSFSHHQIAMQVLNDRIIEANNQNSEADIELKQISLKNNLKMSQMFLEKELSMHKLKNLEALKNKIRVMDQKQKSKLRKMALAGERAQKAFNLMLQKGMD